MTAVLKLLSALGLALTVVPAVLVFLADLPWDTHATLMAVGTVLWFATAPFWLRDAAPDPELWEQGRVE
ncbi:hypothetical protein [Rubrivirga sp.]|uniref:hypothetical protein n=1 Tax=Rubrivirga sp. TaxID=1885344 RepID=UPI003B519917